MVTVEHCTSIHGTRCTWQVSATSVIQFLYGTRVEAEPQQEEGEVVDDDDDDDDEFAN